MKKTAKLVLLQMEINDLDFATQREEFKKLVNKKREILTGMDINELFDTMYNIVKQWDNVENLAEGEKWH